MRRFVMTLLAVACTSPELESAAPADAPLGLWIWSADAPDPSAEIAVRAVEDGWTATIDGETVPVTREGDTITLPGPDGHLFVGEATEDGSAIQGYWHQPSTVIGYSDIVTPVVLPAVRDGRWAGTAEGQPRTFRMFLDVFEDEDGALGAVLRNPERNEIMASEFKVERNGDAGWTLVAGTGDQQRRQSLKRGGDAVVLDHAWFDAPLTMRRASASEAVGYFPRDPAEGAARYVPPADLDDGWTVAAAEDAGFDRHKLDALVATLSATDPRERRPRLVHSVLVAHEGKLVLEEYFYGHDRETAHDTRSLGKVFAPLLIGALRQQGSDIDAEVRPIRGVLATVGEELGDPRKADVTLGHLMTFTSGLDCDAYRDSPGNEDTMWAQEKEDDFWLYTARLPLLHEPGERYAYCSGSINLAGSSLREAGGKPIVQLIEGLIAEPLAFGPYHWNVAPNGAAYLGGGAYMRPRDVLKIGVLFAEGGVWNGEQVIEAAWVEESTTAKIAITPETTGMTPDEFSNSYFGGAAAYEWRVDEVRVGEHSYPSYEASGNGGQVLIVLPDLDLTVLFTGGNYRQGGVWGRWRDEIVGGHIIPAMSDLP